MIVLRKISEYDIGLLFYWKKNCKIIKSSKNNHNITIDHVGQWIRNQKENCISKCWIIESGGIKIGIIHLNYMDYENKTCSVEIYIADEHFRKRKITPILLYKISEYIFEEIKFEEIYCDIMESNKRAVDVFLKFGFEICGYFKGNNFFNEKIDNIVYIKMTKDTWKKVKENYEINEMITFK